MCHHENKTAKSYKERLDKSISNRLEFVSHSGLEASEFGRPSGTQTGRKGHEENPRGRGDEMFYALGPDAEEIATLSGWRRQ
jgi:hypothetical protein